MASEGLVRYTQRQGLGASRVVTLPESKAPRCPKPIVLRDVRGSGKGFAKPCESFRCPACGQARRAETVRRVQLGATAAHASGIEAMTLHLTLPGGVDRSNGHEWHELHGRTMQQLRVLRNRAYARSSKFERPKPGYVFVPEVQPGRGSIAPHLLWFGEPPFPVSMADARMDIMPGDNSGRARFRRMKTREGRARSEYLAEAGWGERHVWEPPVEAGAYAGYLTKYIAKRLALADGVEDPVPRGCCRLTYSRGVMPTRAQWAVVRAWVSLFDEIPLHQLCAGKAWFGLRVDGEPCTVRADRRFWLEPWFEQMHGLLLKELGYEKTDDEGPIYRFESQLLALDEDRWRRLGVEPGQAWDGEYRRIA